MAIEGHYQDDAPPAPYVRGQVYLPALRLGAEVNFLVDTGAHATWLMPADVHSMGIDIRRVRGAYQKAEGVGGEARYKTTRALLRFQDNDALGRFQEFEIDVHLMNGRAGQQLPSLLGRDILNECECVLDGVREHVALKRLTSAPL